MTLGGAIIALLLKISIEPEPKRRSVDTLWRWDASRLEGVSLKWCVPCLVVLYFQPTRSTCRFFSISPFDVSVSRKATRRSWHNRKVTEKSSLSRCQGGAFDLTPPQKSEKKLPHVCQCRLYVLCCKLASERPPSLSIFGCVLVSSLSVKCRPTKSSLAFRLRSHLQFNNKRSSRLRVPRKWPVKTKSFCGNSIHKWKVWHELSHFFSH